MHVVGSAGDDQVSVRFVVVALIPVMIVVPATAAAAFHCEIRTTSVVDPNTSAIRTPAVAFLAGRIATLASESHATSNVCFTIVPTAIVRRAGDSVTASWTAVLVCIYREVRPASVVDPDSSAIRTPAIAFLAGRLAALLEQPNPARRG